MKLCERNLRKLYYATYKEKTPIKDEQGYETGAYRLSYNPPIELKANISAARGTSETEQFGVNLDYEKVVLVGDVNCPINETSILWIDTVPTINEEGETETPFDYLVVKVARSLNNVAYAVRKVIGS